MDLSTSLRARTAGVLLGQAIGDALGVPYEFSARIQPGQAEMIGGGLGPYAPGEWSDDTQMALCIARVSATGADLTTEAGLTGVAEGFLDWQTNGASDIGVQTSMVLRQARTGAGSLVARMTAAAEQAAASGRAGNGALMRTGVVGLVALDDPDKTAEAARRVAALTHAHPLCLDSAVLWSEAVRLAVTEGVLDVRAGVRLLPVDRQGEWLGYLDDAETLPPASFAKNGFTVTALQAAWAAICSTRHIEGPDHVEAALQAAIAIGHDTDTVAAIAGALLGARYGVAGLPSDLARRVHGWPGMRARDLVRLASATAGGGQVSIVPSYTEAPLGLPHPDDDQVILGSQGDLARCAELGVDAVVSLSRVSDAELAATGIEPGRHVEIWLIDSDFPDDNSSLAWTLTDAARTIARLRAEGARVLLHCVAAHHRTPSVALAYSRLLGVPAGEAAQRIVRTLGRDIDGLLWATAKEI